jgi:stage III sporulation protein AG
MRGIYMNNDNFLSKFTEYIKTKLNSGNENNKNDNSKKSDKLLGNLILMILVAVVIVLASSFFKTPKSISTAAASETQKDKIVKENNLLQFNDYELQLENKLKSTLEGIEGVGRVQLMIYFESGEESIPAVNINDSESLTKEKDTEGGERNTTQKNNGSTVVITNNGNANAPLIVKKYKPTITGVCVVAEGANERVTELRIREAVINLFNLPEKKVNVYPMNN